MNQSVRRFHPASTTSQAIREPDSGGAPLNCKWRSGYTLRTRPFLAPKPASAKTISRRRPNCRKPWLRGLASMGHSCRQPKVGIAYSGWGEATAPRTGGPHLVTARFGGSGSLRARPDASRSPPEMCTALRVTFQWVPRRCDVRRKPVEPLIQGDGTGAKALTGGTGGGAPALTIPTPPRDAAARGVFRGGMSLRVLGVGARPSGPDVGSVPPVSNEWPPSAPLRHRARP
jgi:hypothetical protein